MDILFLFKLKKFFFFFQIQGDVTPTNPREVVYVMFAMIFACFLFAYSFNQVGAIVLGN